MEKYVTVWNTDLGPRRSSFRHPVVSKKPLLLRGFSKIKLFSQYIFRQTSVQSSPPSSPIESTRDDLHIKFIHKFWITGVPVPKNPLPPWQTFRNRVPLHEVITIFVRDPNKVDLAVASWKNSSMELQEREETPRGISLIRETTKRDIQIYSTRSKIITENGTGWSWASWATFKNIFNDMQSNKGSTMRV